MSKNKQKFKNIQDDNINKNQYQKKTDFEKMLSQMDLNQMPSLEEQIANSTQENQNQTQQQNDVNIDQNANSIDQNINDTQQQQNQIEQTINNQKQDSQLNKNDQKLFQKFKKELKKANRTIKKIKNNEKSDKQKIKDLEINLNILKTQYEELKYQNNLLKSQIGLNNTKSDQVDNQTNLKTDQDFENQAKSQINSDSNIQNDQEEKVTDKEKMIDEEAQNLADYLLKQTNSIDSDEEKNKILLKAKQLVEDPQQEMNELKNLFQEKKQKQIKQIELDLLQKAEIETDIKKKQKILNSVKQLEDDPQQVLKAIQEKVLEDQFMDNIPEKCKQTVKNALKIKNFDKLAFLAQVPQKTKIKNSVEQIINDNHMNEFISKFFVDWLTDEVQRSIGKEEKQKKKTKTNKNKVQKETENKKVVSKISNDQFKNIENNSEDSKLDGKNSLSNLVEIISQKLNFKQFQILYLIQQKMYRKQIQGHIVNFLSNRSFKFQIQQQNGTKSFIKIILLEIKNEYMKQYRRMKKGQTLMINFTKFTKSNLIYLDNFEKCVIRYKSIGIIENIQSNKRLILQVVFIGVVFYKGLKTSDIMVFVDKKQQFYFTFQKILHFVQGDVFEIENYNTLLYKDNIYQIFFDQYQSILRSSQTLNKVK